ncbi:hypothetical protein O206_14940 [Ochrobactrum sp. EGD-AQ16]|nr:hypothetical protein O206_14940 [Ochrobactrum sp. EGD-AQ16]
MTTNGDKALVAHFMPICDRLLMLPFTIHCSRPVLAAEFSEPQDILSWSLTRPGFVRARSGEAHAACLATIGLTNAGRVGERAQMMMPAGTINLLVHIDRPLSVAAHLEAMSIAAEARTAAIMELGLDVGSRVATGTGTDCIAVSAPPGEQGEGASYAGLHTDIGAALGGAVYDAVSEGGRLWMKERGF